MVPLVPSDKWWPPRGVSADRLLALVVALVSVVELTVGDVVAERRPLAFVGIVLMATPLAWRRRNPLACELVVLGGLVGLNAADVRIDDMVGPSAAILVCVYSVAQYEERLRAAVGAVFACVAVAASVLAVSNKLGDYAYAAVLVAAAWVPGRVVRARLLQVAGLTENAVRLEMEQTERQRAAVADERTRIARELHDVIAHSVTAIVVQAGAAQGALPPEAPRVHAALDAIQSIGRSAQTELVRLLGLLRSDHAEIGLAPQPTLADISALVEQVRTAGVPIELCQRGSLPTVSDGLGLTAYRIVQEALTNIQRHAGPVATTIDIGCDTGQLQIDIENTGAIEPLVSVPGSGHGLVGMRERAALYGGTVEAKPRPDGGFRVIARLPIDGAHP